jgi:hypothetical protein
MEKEYLSSNIECKWIIANKNIKSNNIKKNYNIISVVYFNYKDKIRFNTDEEITIQFKRYYDGLLDIIKKFRNIFDNNFLLRIYYDDTVVDKINQLLEDTNHEFDDYIELFKYDIPLFKKDGQHQKTVGTLIRFLPLFDYDLHKVDKCIILDIDNKLSMMYKNIFNFFFKNDVKISYRSRLCYFINKRIKCISKDFYYGIIASFIYQSISIDKKIMTDFLEDTFITKKNKKIIDKCGLEDEFSYGIDEIFINSSYIEYFLKNKINIHPLIFNHNDITNGLYKFFYIMDTSNYKELSIYKNFVVNFYKIFRLTIIFDQEYDKNTVKNTINNYQKTLDFKLRKQKYNKKELYRFLIHSVKTIKIKDFKLLIDCIFKNLKLNLNKINIHELDTEMRENKRYIKDTKYHYIDF